jgi:hypothetical protein
MPNEISDRPSQIPENLEVNSASSEPNTSVPEQKPKFDPWAMPEQSMNTNEVNVIPKLPGRRRAPHYRGRSGNTATLPGLAKLERNIGRIIRENPDATEEEIIQIIQGKASKKRPAKFDSSTIRTYVQGARSKTRKT